MKGDRDHGSTGKAAGHRDGLGARYDEVVARVRSTPPVRHAVAPFFRMAADATE